jgi:ribose transport system permease protein
MSPSRFAPWSRLPPEYGLLLVLAVLCGTFSVLTSRLDPTGDTAEAAARLLATDIVQRSGPGAGVLIVAGTDPGSAPFAERMREQLEREQATVLDVVQGDPRDVRRVLVRIAESGQRLDAVVTTPSVAGWQVLTELGQDFPSLAGARVVTPPSYRWPVFLQRQNLWNIANQIAVIAILAIGMTMVIITGGIDLSVGSLVALAAVTTALLIERLGAVEAPAAAMVLACLAGVLACGLVGLFNGVMVTLFRMPSFLVTLAMMQVASGLAGKLTGGESVSDLPPSFKWLGTGADLFGVPNAVLLMLLLYAVAHVLMTRTVLGRYLYAVGGNARAARLSGVPVRRVVIFAYVASGLLAGLGGVILTSQLKSGAPIYGRSYELYVIAAVVVGGTSLSGGRGKIFGTLLGALLIAVLWNGMNLTNVDPYSQMIVFGLVILGAVLFDQLRRGWRVPEA